MRVVAVPVAQSLLVAAVCNLTGAAVGQWSDPAVVFRTPNPVSQPTLAADSTGRLDLVWSVVEGTDPTVERLYFSRGDGSVWSPPRHIASSTAAHGAILAADPYGELHLLWSGPMGSVQYSPLPFNARLSGVHLASESGLADLVADTVGRLHVVYQEPKAGPSYRGSADGGAQWSKPVRIAAPSAPASVAYDPRLAVGSDGVLHAVWGEYEPPRTPSGVFYARSTDGGATWSPAVPLAGAGANQIAVAAAGDRTVHVAWNGSGWERGRFHRWSSDAGATWSPVQQVVDRGTANAPPQLAIDSSGALHLVTAYEKDIWHSVWDGTSWRDPECISCGSAESSESANGPAALIAGGNVLHVVYRQGAHELRHTAARLAAPPLPPAPPQTVGWWTDRFWHRDLRHVPALLAIVASIALVRILRQWRDRGARAAS